MKDIALREKMSMPDPQFPIKVVYYEKHERGVLFNSHWHNHMELLYFIKGRARIQCDKTAITAGSGSLVVVNCRDIHSGESVSSSLGYYCVILDMELLKGIITDSSHTKFIIPIIENHILFKNFINDENVNGCIESIIDEYLKKSYGYELVIKSNLFRLFSILVRKYPGKELTQAESNQRLKNLQRFKKVLEYVEENCMNRLTIDEAATVANLSVYHFCRIFKEITGKSFIDYLNCYRIGKAEEMLKSSCGNVTETAMACGFSDVNYFSKMFKRYKGMPPSHIPSNPER